MLAPQVQLHDNAGAVSIHSGGGAIQLFLNPSVAGQLLLRGFAALDTHPGTRGAAQPRPDGSLLLQLPLGTPGSSSSSSSSSMGSSAGAASQPLSRLQRAPPPGNAVTTASRSQAGAIIVLDAGVGWLGLGQQGRAGQGRAPRQCATRWLRVLHAAGSWQLISMAEPLILPPMHAALAPHVVAGGSGRISLTERSWMEALRQRWS